MSFDRPSIAEEEFFLRSEAARLRKHQEEESARRSEEEKRRVKDLHWMKCPKCGNDLQEIHYRGVNLDKCFSCEGLWFDNGELAHLQPEEVAGFVTSLRRIFTR